MSDNRLTREERETHIWFNDLDNTMEIFTESPVMIRKLEKIAPAHDAELQDAGFHGVRVTLPKRALTIRKPRVLTPEQRRASAERMQAVREKQLADA